MSKQITIQQGQTLRDIAMQYYGCADGVQRIKQLNNIGYGILVPGTQLLVDSTVPMLTDTNLQVMRFYNRLAVVVNSNFSTLPTPVVGFPFTLPFTLS